MQSHRIEPRRKVKNECNFWPHAVVFITSVMNYGIRLEIILIKTI